MRRKNNAPQGQPVSYDLSEVGAASAEVRELAHRLWSDAGGKAGIDLTGFDPKAPLTDRIAWAVSQGLSIGTVLTRFSTKMQGSTEDQVRVNVEYASRNRIYCPPELLCVDEAAKGRKVGRPALVRCQSILQRRLATVLLVFKLSRLSRKAHQAKRFIEEEIVEAGLRAIAVGHNIDTSEGKNWRLMVGIHGAMDEDLLSAMGDHAREGLVGLFLKGWTTGALALGYKPVPVEGAPLTRRGHPRTMPAVDEKVAVMIREHFGLIAGGMSLREGWRKWRRDGGAVDKRCKTGVMGYYAYVRMLSRADYIGLRQFCRKRNQWSSKADTIQQKVQPAEEVKVFQCEELRIVDDETYWKVQRILKNHELGPVQRVLNRDHHLWDLVIGTFKCPHCQDARAAAQRFHMCGAKGAFMRCPNPECLAPVMVNRREAVEAICKDLSARLVADTELVQWIVDSFGSLGAEDDDQVVRDLAAKERQLRQVKQKIRDTEELLGSGNDEDRSRRKGLIRAAEQERSGYELEVLELRRRCNGGRPSATPITRAQVEQSLAELLKLLDDAAAGRLGSEVVGKAVRLFTDLVDGAIFVQSEKRRGRRRSVVRGRYTPSLIRPIQAALGESDVARPADVNGTSMSVEIWLRKPPRVDQLANEVYQLYEQERIGFRLINQRLEAKYREKIGSGNICAAWRRWYEMRGLPLPPPRTNTGRPRRRAG